MYILDKEFLFFKFKICMDLSPFGLVSVLHKFIVLITFPSFTCVYIGTEILFKPSAGLRTGLSEGSPNVFAVYRVVKVTSSKI